MIFRRDNGVSYIVPITKAVAKRFLDRSVRIWKWRLDLTYGGRDDQCVAQLGPFETEEHALEALAFEMSLQEAFLDDNELSFPAGQERQRAHEIFFEIDETETELDYEGVPDQKPDLKVRI